MCQTPKVINSELPPAGLRRLSAFRHARWHRALFGLKLALRWLKLPPSCLLLPILPPMLPASCPRWPQDGNLRPTCRQHGSFEAQLGPTWPHLGLILKAKNSISRGRGCIFEHFAVMRLKTSKMASRRPQEAPKRLQESPKSLQESPEAPRRPHEGPKTAPRRLHVASASPANASL